MVLRDWVRFWLVDCRLLTAAVKRFWMAPSWLWKLLTVASAESTDWMVAFAPATVSTFWLAAFALPKEIDWPPAAKPRSAEPAPADHDVDVAAESVSCALCVAAAMPRRPYHVAPRRRRLPHSVQHCTR